MSLKGVLKRLTANPAATEETSGLTHPLLPDSHLFTEAQECWLVMLNPEDRTSEAFPDNLTTLENLIIFPAQVIGGFNSVTKKCLSCYIDLIKRYESNFGALRPSNASHLNRFHHYSLCIENHFRFF